MHTTDLAAGNLLIPNGTFIVELIIFAIVLFVMWRFVVPPIVRAMEERSERVARTAQERQEAATKLAEAQSRYENALRDARREAGEIRGEARAEGARLIEELRERTNTEVGGIQRTAEAELAQQRERALRELQGDINPLSVTLASRVVGANLSATAKGDS
jgi:F-type H+-transporting ATPase subunit b